MKKLTILFIATFIMSLVFFSSYFVVQEVRGDIGIGSPINMGGGQIKKAISPWDLSVGENETIARDYFECLERVCFQHDTEHRAAEHGLGEYCVTNMCQINDFEWCSEPPPENYGCFTAKTPVLMADGRYKPIEEVKEGDWILTKESESSDKMVSAKVAKTFEHTVNNYLVINNNLKVTDIHPIFVNGKWKQAQAIKLGDKLLNEKGQEVVVESLKLKRGEIKVYNLEIEGPETYFAGGFYVHNKPIEEDKPLRL